MKKIFALSCAVVLLLSCSKDEPGKDFKVVSFENVVLNSDGIHRGSLRTGQKWLWDADEFIFTVDDLTFVTAIDPIYGSWAGVEVSGNASMDEAVSGPANDSYVYGVKGAMSTSKFAVIYDNSPGAMNDADKARFKPYMAFDPGVEKVVDHLYIANSAYFYWYAKTGTGDFMNGPGFENGDYFGVRITGYDRYGAEKGHVDFDLADYRNGRSWILGQWNRVNLTSLGLVNRVTFAVYGSDTYNAPGYLCIDEISVEE